MSNHEFSLLKAQQNIHELIARQHPLEESLTAIAQWIGMMMPGALVSIMRFVAGTNTLNLVTSPRFSGRYTRSMQDIPVADDQGPCGTAAFTRQLVITDNIQKDPRWSGYHDIAEAEGLRACRSMPILSAKGELLGTFATYYRNPAAPTEEGTQRNLARGAALVALAVLRNRDAEDHLALSEWHQALFDNHPDGACTLDSEGRFQSCNTAMQRMMGYSEQELTGRHFNRFVEPDYREQTLAAFNKARSGEAVTFETVGTHAFGKPCTLEIVNLPVTIKGDIVGVYGICRDITD
ncbi:MAG: PAS domain S-box protein, partial [Marinobacter sp.]